MSYVSLARKYRPRRFADMVGQESTTLALTNAIRLRREPHSVIFTGVRGIGKTTSARIYAKALNCEKGPTAEPCDVCASCVAIVSGNHEDVLEIDGASNTGVDDVRALQETLSYVPQRSTYKIYIIDEVHMLSISAFNALLKTLEEPPQHVVFIFATTELHKVPETIQSRCQTFHLQKISRPVIADRVRSILTAEGIPFDEAALALVAREGRGSMRDALTMLDQAIAVGGGEVSLEALKNMVGSSSQALPVLELLDGLLRKDATQILEVIGRWDQEGLAMSTLVEETAKACRNAFILRDLKGQAIDLQLLELEDREQQMLLELGEKAAPMDLNRLFRQLAKCLDDLRFADLDRFILENYCLEWCFDPGLPDLQALMNIIASGQPMPPIAARPAPQAAPALEGPAINLRERWKTSSPSAPATRPTVAPQASAPAKATGPQATPPGPAAKPVAPTPGSASSQVSSTQPMASAGAPSMAHKPMASQPIAPSPGPAMASQTQTAAATQPVAHNAAPASSLLKKLAMAQAASAAQHAPQAQPTSKAQTATHSTPQVQAASEAQTVTHSAPRVQAALASQTAAQNANQAQPTSAAQTSQHALQAQAASAAQNVQPATQPQAASAAQTTTFPASQAQPAAPARPMMEAQPEAKTSGSLRPNQPAAPSPKPAPQAFAKPQTQAPASHQARPGAMAKGQSQPPEPMPPFDMTDEDIPPWILQEEASRQGAVAAPMDEPILPEPPKNEGFLKQMARKATTMPSEPPAPKMEVPAPAPSPAAAPSEPVWPENWRAFVDEWKKQKPLQGRILEEAYLLEYSPQRIRLAVEPSSMAGGKLLQQDVRKRLMEQFTQLFGFKGMLEAVPKADAHPGKTAGEAPQLGETLLDVKNREREVAREQLRVRLEEHPMTREVISRFGGTIEQIELQ
ncbi:DNA polymerase III subunit gamma/tau [Oligoflexus tunisiensis]|uniref:DNA polymerase III subunit gamma/tau n=1 Tax=Oligoflexus tunisiensis TaxID=708132 RepID=UPI000ACEC448|nr:DNA polymerase III subunit gamma/tau [Oligoflexus tunisiensis]